MVTLQDLKHLMCEAGLDEDMVAAVNATEPLLLQGFDSVDFPVFALAVEERYGKTVSDRDALKLKTLNDFLTFINRGS
jgi:acyl carrier protein